MRSSVAVEGEAQSVQSTGSQTTNTRTGLAENSFRMRSAAEAPCRQYGQVGDNSKSNRTSSFAALKAFLTSVTLRAVRLSSGAWPAGVWLPP